MNPKRITVILMILATALFSTASFAGSKELKIKSNFDEEHCQARIEKEFSFTKGVTDVQADIATQTVTIRYKEDQTDADALVSTLKKLGYSAEVISNSCCEGKDIQCGKSAPVKSCAKKCAATKSAEQ